MLKRFLIVLSLTTLITWVFPIQVKIVQAKQEPVQVWTESDVTVVKDPVAGQIAYDNWLKSVYIRQPVHEDGFNVCSCVSYARWRSGIDVGSIGVARNHPVNSKTPSVGAIVVTYESGAGHLAYVVNFDDQFIYLDEANYSKCSVTHNRALSINSRLIKGYFK